MKVKSICIVGLGLIGGSFALAIRKAGFAESITGWDANSATLETALSRGIIDSAELPGSSINQAKSDLILLATPVRAIINFLRENGPRIQPGTIVTDAGSTKREICAAAESLTPGVDFVGGHPMGGSHRIGLDAASADLFRGAPYGITSCGKTSEVAVQVVTELAEAIGARPVMLSAEDHDRAVAMFSHAPQLVSTAMALAALRCEEPDSAAMAGPGFSSSIRLAASQWSVWEDICRTNADEISRALGLVSRQLEEIRLAIERGDFDEAGASFRQASDFAGPFLIKKSSQPV